jgi:hypothetical protein
MNELREQRRAAGLPEHDTPVSISQRLEGDQILVGKLANKSPEALNLAKGEITAIENEAVPNSPRGDSFGYSRDFNLTKRSMSNRRERIISLTYDRFRRHLTLPAGQRPVLYPTSKNVETHAIAFARLTMTEKLQIYPDLEPGWRAGIEDSLTPEHQAALARNLAVQKSGIAPIEDLTLEDATLALQILRENVVQWRPDFDPIAFRDTGILNIPLENLSEEQRTDVRLYQTHRICRLMSEMSPTQRALYSPSAIYFEGAPAGMMLMTASRNPPYIGNLVTHPGVLTAGSALIEHAVNTSVAWFYNGQVQLMADSPGARRAYLAMGFVATIGNYMALDPSTSDKWVQTDGGLWRLRAHIDDRFLVGISEDAESDDSW